MLSKVPRSLLMASLISGAAPLLAAAAPSGSVPMPPLPDGVPPIVGWLLLGLCAAGSGPAAWLAWQLSKTLAALGAGGLKALGGWVRHVTRKSPSKLDDAPGELVAKALEDRADELVKEAMKAGKDKGEE